MIIRILLALIALVGVMAFLGWYGKANDAQRNRALKNILIYAVAGALLLLVVTGRIPWLFAIVSATLPFWRKILAARSLLVGLQRFTGRSFTKSQLTTEWLRIRFDVVARQLDADILKGTYANQALSQLNDDAIQALLAECAGDKQSVAAIYAYLRARGFGWQSGEQAAPPPASETPSISADINQEQALEILGLDNTASKDDIRKAHKRLIQKLHPDRGGSDYLAAQINAAKDRLLDN